MKHLLKGIIPAVFTPLNQNYSINYERISEIVEFLISDHVSGFYICGSTGEGPLLSTEERMAVANHYIKAVNGRYPVVIQIGHQSIVEARKLAQHAQESGADAISAIPPNYFRISDLDILIHCIHEIASAAPMLPFYYYHIPRITGIEGDMVEFLTKSIKNIPTLAGIKYSDFKVFELQACIELQKGHFNMLFGCDEMLLSGLVGGAHGAVGSTFNIAAALYNKIYQTYNNGNIEKAKKLQSLSVKMVRTLLKHGGQPAFKTTMKFLGIDCGPNRLPHKNLQQKEVEALKMDLSEIGFFDWGRK